eukprot:CAMPEP_0117756832 /NCGR_PEP_ID=MMETSP0947-20121206/14339_1 /TAXON_ID=44440 /ORGANISM="Chattonella subsalsa, Strain CCMP2191" /LENGTH=336 /DNA_ID=CAMNT_0005576547 /DNA_START=180 /DNA_END=1190 /DNA_ORIENTATION=+
MCSNFTFKRLGSFWLFYLRFLAVKCSAFEHTFSRTGALQLSRNAPPAFQSPNVWTPPISKPVNLLQLQLSNRNKVAEVPATEKTIEKERQEELDLLNVQLEEDEAESVNERNNLITTAVASGAVVLALFLGTNSQIDFQQLLKDSIAQIEALGPVGVFYFGALYTIAELLAIPATPLTISSGYLFGVVEGTLVVWCSAVIAASISFQLGRTLFRDRILELFKDNPKFKAIDKAVEEEGLKLVLLLRLSPVFPFALSNYLYGLTSVGFWPYLIGTAVGFLPGTIAYVYTGEIGKTLTDGASSGLPPIAYVGILAGFGALLKVVADVATNALGDLEED